MVTAINESPKQTSVGITRDSSHTPHVRHRANVGFGLLKQKHVVKKEDVNNAQ